MCQIFVRPSVKDLKPYEPGMPIEEVQRRLGLPSVIKMASNENPVGPSPKALKEITKNLSKINLYPDGGGYYLKRKLSSFLGVKEEQIILGNGSDEIIRMIVETFLNEGEEAVIAHPSFIIYQMAVRIMNGKCRIVRLRDYRYDLKAMAKEITGKTKIIFIANPNNPTGTMVGKDEVEAFLEEVPEGIITVFDEAYFEYIERADFPETIEYVRDGKLIIALRTFSKIYGLAGLRIGYGISHPEIVEEMNRVRQPFNVNSVAQIAATAALDDREHLRKSREINSAGKDFLYGELKKIGCRYVPSEANFMLVDVGDGKKTVEKLLKNGIIVRDMACYDMPNFVRVTVGLQEENKKFIKALSEIT